MSLDVPNTYIQAYLPEQKKGERVIMKIRGMLVDWLVQLDPTAYSPYVVYKRGVRVLYLVVLKAIYGMLETELHWYRKFRKDLKSINFVFNDYDPFVVNRFVSKGQHTIHFYVDDILSSHLNGKINDKFAKWA